MGNRCRPIDPSRRNAREPLSLEVLYAPRRAIRDLRLRHRANGSAG